MFKATILVMISSGLMFTQEAPTLTADQVKALNEVVKERDAFQAEVSAAFGTRQDKLTADQKALAEEIKKQFGARQAELEAQQTALNEEYKKKFGDKTQAQAKKTTAAVDAAKATCAKVPGYEFVGDKGAQTGVWIFACVATKKPAAGK